MVPPLDDGKIPCSSSYAFFKNEILKSLKNPKKSVSAAVQKLIQLKSTYMTYYRFFILWSTFATYIKKVFLVSLMIAKCQGMCSVAKQFASSY